ncbi:MAG: hypothetical protein AMXMBFR74_05900 [Parvibaculum sp.]|uniref:autotransporter domain-containing protein n=1 Tax=Parvibaculum sp. TaxID=2024848 RepID=UPI0035B844F9
MGVKSGNRAAAPRTMRVTTWRFMRVRRRAVEPAILRRNLTRRLLSGVGIAALLTGASLALLPAPARADTSWTGAADGDWNNAANWSNGLPVNTSGTTKIEGPVAATVDGIGVTDSGRTNIGGSTQDGSLIVEGGGTLNVGVFELFGYNGFSGTATIRGAGSGITASSDTFVGAYTGIGHIFIEDGGTLTTPYSTYMSQYNGSLGTVTVTGSGSTWNSGSTIRLGGSEGNYDATGILTIADEGHVNIGSGNSDLQVANSAGSTGTLNIGAAEGDAAVAAGTLNAASVAFGAGDGTVVFNHTETDYIFSPSISGNGEVRQLAGTTILTGANSWTGGTTISGGMLAGNTASLVGDILNNATLAFDQSADGSFSGAVSGTGSLVKLGNGVLTLTGTNSYGGGTTVSAGTLRAGNATAFVAGTAYTVNGGTLDFNDFSRTIAALSGTGGTVDLGSATLTVDQSVNTVFAGAIGGSGGLVKSGAGTLSLTGASVWTGNTSVDAGTLGIVGGGTVSNTTGYIGNYATGTGEVTVSGAGSTWTNSAQLRIGDSGNGTLDITGGGVVFNTTSYVGLNVGGTGEVTVSGAGSTWTNSADLNVGFYDTGTLDITDGGAVSNTTAYIGRYAGGTGDVTVDGADSIWTNSGNLYIGNYGTGTLGITGGGTVSNASQVYIGRESAGTGEVTVDGADSTWTNSSYLIVGDRGTGTLGITGGGTVSNTEGNIGFIAGGTGDVTVDGADSTWTNSSELFVGRFGTGTLGITGGGAVSNTAGYIGFSASGIGEVTVTGADSIWTNSNSLDVGRSGSGTLGITGGGAVSSTTAYIGRYAGGTGGVTVNGADSTWTNSGQLRVGDAGTGTLDIAGGGAVSATIGYIGLEAGSTGDVTVSGADSTLTNSGTLAVGFYGAGTLDITDGGTVSNTEAYIGQAASAAGEVTVDGADSTWTNSGELTVGRYGTGTLGITGGGTVEVGGGAGTVRIADQAGSTGTLNIGAASGDAAVAAGTLDAASVVFGAGTGTLVFNHMDSDYLFAAGISGAGEVLVENGEMVLTAAATHTGGTTISGGTLQLGNGGATGSVSGGIVNDGTLVIDRSNAFTWAGVMSGAGDFRQAGAGATTLTGDSSAFAGATFVDAGALIVNGLLGGTLDVGAGLLGGSGTVGTTALGAGAIFAPGNSIGTLNVAGDLLFGSLSIYEVELDDGGNTPGVNNDFIDVAGALTIDSGASVSVRPENGTDDGSTYTPGLVYTILSAANGITGAFDAVTASFAFLTPSLDYDANNVYLTLNIVADFQDVAQTPNQQGVANTVQTFGPGNTLYDGLLGLTEDQARSAFNSLSGEAHASASTAPLPGMQQIRQQILDRLARIFGGGFGGFGSAAAKQAPAAGDAPAPGHAVWGQLFGSWGKTDGNAVSAAIDRDSYGFIGGADREIAPGVHAGVALGYSRSTWDVSARSSSGDSDNFHIAGYAGTTLGAVDLKGVVSYAYGRADTDRTVIVGVLTNELSASYATHTFQAGIEAGYDLDMGPVVLTPFAGLVGVHVETEGFTETGGPAALTFASTGNTTGVTTLGLRARHQAGSVGMTGAAAWRHAFGDVEPTSRAAFASSPAATFAVRGAPLVRDALAVEGGFEARIDRAATLSFGYSGEYSSDTRDHALMAELRVEF